MTTELEKQFFDTFEIHPNFDPWLGDVYPQITDRHYLELYCALCDAFNLLNINRTSAFAFKVKYFKECVLKDLIGIEEFYKSEYVKHQVQAIFEGER